MKLWEHQTEAIIKARSCDNFALLWEPGTGKTATSIAMFKERWERMGRMMKTLVLAPPVVLSNWRDELKKFGNIDQDHICLLQGSAKKRIEKFKPLVANDSAKQIVITNYEAMQNG